MSLSDDFLKIASASAIKGDTIVFWNDVWNFGLLKERFPQLHSFAKKPKCSVYTFLQGDNSKIFWLPLSMEASAQLDELSHPLDAFELDPLLKDDWSYMWGSQVFHPKKLISS